MALDTHGRLALDDGDRRTSELAAASAIRLNLEHDPALVPLETLAGRNHHQFPAGEQPPWRWRVPSVYPG